MVHNMKKKNQEATKKSGAGKAAGLIFAVVLVILAVVYVTIGFYFREHFCFRTTVDGIPIGGKSAADVESLVREKIDGYSLTLAGREGGSDVIASVDVGLTPVFDGEIEQLLQNQNGFAWGFKLLRPDDYLLDSAVSYDAAKLDEVLKQLAMLAPGSEREPADAHYSDYKADTGYELVPADYGTTLDREKLRAAVEEAMLTLRETLDLDQSGCYVEPKVQDDDTGLLSLIESLNEHIGVTVTYDLIEQTEVLDRETIHTWLSVENGRVKLDEEAVGEYVKELGRKYNTAYKPKTFLSSYDEEVTIQNSVYGWRIDREAETAQLLEDIRGGKDVTREPVYAQTANSHGENDFGDSYVEINLTKQHLFCYKDGELIVESDFVSGNVSNGNATPTGVFPLTYKTLDATLRGENYATPVKYWMPFNGNVGMHDANWRRSFGGTIYKTGGSHGCINLPPAVAAQIYEVVEKGYPVLVYTMPGHEYENVGPQPEDEETTVTAADVISQIDSVGNVTIESEGAILQARSMYDALPDEEKAAVTNYPTLLKQEEILAGLKGQTGA